MTTTGKEAQGGSWGGHLPQTSCFKPQLFLAPKKDRPFTQDKVILMEMKYQSPGMCFLIILAHTEVPGEGLLGEVAPCSTP